MQTETNKMWKIIACWFSKFFKFHQHTMLKKEARKEKQIK